MIISRTAGTTPTKNTVRQLPGPPTTTVPVENRLLKS